jgi:hypothetical protein
VSLLKVLEILPVDTKSFLHPALVPPTTSKKRESEKDPQVPSRSVKISRSSKSVPVVDGVSLGHIDLMVVKLNKGIFGNIGKNKGGHSSQILFDLNARFEIVLFVPQRGGMLCMVTQVSRLSTEEMRHVSDFKLKWREEGFQTYFGGEEMQN